MGHLILEIQHTLGIKEIIMKYFKLLFVIVIFFGFLQGQTKNAKWVLSSQKNYNRLTEEAKELIKSNGLDDLIQQAQAAIQEEFKQST